MLVTLISYTTSPEQVIILATRECYQSFAKQSGVSDRKLLEHTTKKAESPLEFADFTFRIEGLSRVTSHQLVRHRQASYAQKSQRYCAEGSFQYVTPPSIAEDPAALFAYAHVMTTIRGAYIRLKELGIKSEDARYVLPGGCTTSLICKMNARSFLNFAKVRGSKKAQWEIRELQKQMKELIGEVAPNYVSAMESSI